MFTLWDILNTLDIEHLVTAIRQLSYGHSAFRQDSQRVPHEVIIPVCLALEKCHKPFLEMGFKTSAGMIWKFLDSARRNMEHLDWTGIVFSERCHAVFSAIQCETQGVFCLKLEKQGHEYLDGSNKISQYVEDRFPLAVSEIKDAAECLSFERYTACVFHLMRAVEVVLKATWKTLGLNSPSLADNWGSLLKPIDEQLKVPVVNPNPVWQANMLFFSELVHDIRAAKRRYRDSTMHVESTYTAEDAKGILDAVVTMLRHAANRLDQEGNVFPLT